MMMHRLGRTAGVMAMGGAALMAAGCSTYRHEYPDHSSQQVWSAALAVAESPDYGDTWNVTENHVWIDDEWARIEVTRELRRIVKKPYHQSVKERRDWQFRIELVSDDPATLEFTNRNPTIPGWSYDEAERFFTEVDEMLLAVPAAGVEDAEPATQPEVQFNESEMDGQMEDDAAGDDGEEESADILDMVNEEEE